MEFDATQEERHSYFPYVVSLSLLRQEMLVVHKPTDEMLSLLRQVGVLCNAAIKGAGSGSEECVFVPGKIVKKKEIVLEGESPVPLLRTIIIPLLFTTHQVTLSFTEYSQEGTSLYYIRDVLLPYLSSYLSFSKCVWNADSLTLQLKGKYSLDTAPPFFLRQQPELVSLRGVVENYDDATIRILSLSLKELGVPLRLEERHTEGTPLLHLDALFGTSEGYDNDFPFIVFSDAVYEKDITPLTTQFKKDIQEKTLSALVIDDLLLLTSLVGGSLELLDEQQKRKENYLEFLTN